MTRLLSFLLTTIVLMLPCVSPAATYHVDAATGSDTSGDGIITPWQTIAHALTGDRMAEGDTLIIETGTYTPNGVVVDPASGEGGIIIREAEGATVSINLGASGCFDSDYDLLFDEIDFINSGSLSAAWFSMNHNASLIIRNSELDYNNGAPDTGAIVADLDITRGSEKLGAVDPIVDDGTWTLGDGWSISNNKIIASAATGYLQQNVSNAFVENETYEICITTQNVTSDTFRSKIAKSAWSDDFATDQEDCKYITVEEGDGATGFQVQPRSVFTGEITDISVQKATSQAMLGLLKLESSILKNVSGTALKPGNANLTAHTVLFENVDTVANVRAPIDLEMLNVTRVKGAGPALEIEATAEGIVLDIRNGIFEAGSTDDRVIVGATQVGGGLVANPEKLVFEDSIIWINGWTLGDADPLNELIWFNEELPDIDSSVLFVNPGFEDRAAGDYTPKSGYYAAGRGDTSHIPTARALDGRWGGMTSDVLRISP